MPRTRRGAYQPEHQEGTPELETEAVHMSDDNSDTEELNMSQGHPEGDTITNGDNTANETSGTTDASQAGGATNNVEPDLDDTQ